MVRQSNDDAADSAKDGKDSASMANKFTEREFTQYRKAATNPVAFSTPETSRTKIRNCILKKKEMVFLNVYDLTGLNSCLGCCGLSIYHSSIEIYGVEYAFGGHPSESTGVFETQPFYVLAENKLLPPAVKLKAQHQVAFTGLSHTQVQRLIDDFSHEWPGNKYDLLRRNCNHYSLELAMKFNEGFRYPKYINRIAGVAVSIACCLPRSIAHTSFPIDHPFGPKGRQLGTWSDLHRDEVARLGLSQNLMAATSEDPPGEHNVRQYAGAAAMERWKR